MSKIEISFLLALHSSYEVKIVLLSKLSKFGKSSVFYVYEALFKWYFRYLLPYNKLP